MIETTLDAHRVLARQNYPGDYALLRITTSQAAGLQPGHALRIAGVACPVLQTAPEHGWVECLQHHASQAAVGDSAPVAGPVGEPFDLAAATPRALLLADNDGIAAILFLARILRNRQPRVKPFVLFEWTAPPPFRLQPSRIMVPGLPADVIGALPLPEDWGVPSRVACPGQAIPGGFEGAAADLARGWLETLQGVADVTVFAAGGAGLSAAAQALAEAYRLPCQIRTAVL